MTDDEARDTIRTRLDASLVVEAAAGTGKTTALIDRIVAVLAAGRATVEGLVAVTFTEKAAGELKLRLRAGLEAARQRAVGDAAGRRNLERALTGLEEARVSTIHGFCADLLRERPVEARVDPQYHVLPEGEAERLFDAAFRGWLQEQLEDPPEGLRRSLRRRAGESDGPADRLGRAAWLLATWRDFPADWRRDGFDRRPAIDDLVSQLEDFARLSEHCAEPRSDYLYRDTAPARRLRDHVRRAEAVRPRDYDHVEAELVALALDRNFQKAGPGRGRFYAPGVERASVRAAHAELCATLQVFQRAADADLAAALQGELRGAVDRYETLKQRRGALDFIDLLVRASNLLRDCDGVRAAFQTRFTHLFVDEFQDTDPLQAEILLLLSARDAAVRDWRDAVPLPGKLFLVGDPKQSIYRFRRADVGTYLAVKEHLLRSGAECVYLGTSFRAAPALQRFINAAFAPQVQEDPAALQAAYVPLAPSRGDTASQPAVVALPVPHPYGVRGITKEAIGRSLPDAVAAFVEWLVRESGWTVTERERPAVRVPVRAHHVCLLFRRFDSYYEGDVTRGYISALEARGIPHLVVGGRSFHVREEVETMRTALTAIEWPDDELALFATLRGSLFAIGDEALFLYRHAHGKLHPFRIPANLTGALAPIGEVLALLADLHRRRNQRPVATTIVCLLEATRAYAAFALRPSGEQALANVLHLTELARAYESEGGMSFRAFVERLHEDAERAQTAEAPIMEEGSEGVRLMTVHRAKGLEFPVVILADLTTRPVRPPERFIDPERRLCAVRIAGWVPAELREHEEAEARRDAAEAVRVAYVAATRARDILVVPALGDEPFEAGWASCLNGALYPTAQRRRHPTPAAGCPAFAGATVLARPPELSFAIDGVKPGRHTFADHEVVWWDPGALSLGAAPRFGIRQQELLGKEADRAIVETNLERFRAWAEQRAAVLAAGAQASLTVATATARAAASATEPATAAAAVEVVELPRAAQRPAGPRFGALVHAVLATAPLDAARDGIERTCGVQARLLGASADEVGAAVAAVAAALAHPLLDRARTAVACRRETPLTLRAADGTLVEGVVDLAFLEGGMWTVIDFKTDQELAKALEVYRRQVALYAEAVAAATGQQARAILLRV